jgi:hypothetical protein
LIGGLEATGLQMFQSLEVPPTAHSQTLFTTSEWYTTKYHDAFLQVILARYERHRLINGAGSTGQYNTL